MTCQCIDLLNAELSERFVEVKTARPVGSDGPRRIQIPVQKRHDHPGRGVQPVRFVVAGQHRPERLPDLRGLARDAGQRQGRVWLG